MRRRVFVLMGVLLVTASGSVAQEAVGTGFTYQGFLKEGGSPANGAYDFEFRLYDAEGGGNQVGGTVTVDDQAVSNGLFTVVLDFFGGVFAGNARWLGIGVRAGASTGAYMALTPAPVATYAERAPWTGRVKVPADNALATLDSTVYDVGWYTLATVGADGLGLISYYDETNGDLKVAHCANAFCTPYFRRR